MLCTIQCWICHFCFGSYVLNFDLKFCDNLHWWCVSVLISSGLFEHFKSTIWVRCTGSTTSSGAPDIFPVRLWIFSSLGPMTTTWRMKWSTPCDIDLLPIPLLTCRQEEEATCKDDGIQPPGKMRLEFLVMHGWWQDLVPGTSDFYSRFQWQRLRL